jgi:hypothetical protein
VLLQRLADYEFDRLKDLTELSFLRHLKKKVSSLVDDGLDLKLVGSPTLFQVSLVSASTHSGAVLPYRFLNPGMDRYDVVKSAEGFEYKYKPSSASSCFSKLSLQNISKLNAKHDLSEFEGELDSLYSLLNAFPQTIHRRTVEIRTPLQLQVTDSSGSPVGSTPETHRLTLELLEKGSPADTVAAAWFEKHLESESWVLVDLDDAMGGNSLVRCKGS